MLKCASIYTYEIDDPRIALGEVKAQLEEKLVLRKHSVGIVLCHPEFIMSGTLRYIAENLPFDLAGITTASQAVNGTVGELVLTLFVMTSDDVQFRSGVTGDLDDGIDEPVKIALDTANCGMTEQPKLALIFPPLMLKYAGDAYINACEQVIPNVPIFGSIAVDDTIAFDGSETIHNGENYRVAMPFVLCYGCITPRFILGTLPQNKKIPYRGEITKSDGPFVKEINNISAYRFFESCGIASNSSFSDRQLHFIPFVIEPKKREDDDGTPVVRGVATFIGDGITVFRGNVEEGSTFFMLQSDYRDVLSTIRQKMEEINRLSDINGVLVFPCIVRRMMTMHISPIIELQNAKNAVNPAIPFMAGYAGGEICPTSIRDGIPTNRFHNYSLSVLVV